MSEKSQEVVGRFVDFLSGLDLEKIDLNKIFGGDLIDFSEKFRQKIFSTLSLSSTSLGKIREEVFKRFIENMRAFNCYDYGVRLIHLEHIGLSHSLEDGAIENLYKLFLES